MNYHVTAPRQYPASVDIRLPASKSISNRALILDALTGFRCKLTNLSKANDTKVLQRVLRSEKKTLDVEDAGTVLRFATVYFSMLEGERFITGTERLMQRPMKPLWQALNKLGASVAYEDVDGKKCLRVVGGTLSGGSVTLDASESSQFASALLLCAPAMPNGLNLKLSGNPVSEPYIEMTLDLLSRAGVEFKRSRKIIRVPHQAVKPFALRVESDWSSASYFFGFCALTGCTITMKNLEGNSLQGDAVIVELMKAFGVESRFEKHKLVIEKKSSSLPNTVTINAKDFPDLVPTLTVTALCLGVEATFTGVAHLRHKESDRVDAIGYNVQQAGGKMIIVTDDSFRIKPPQIFNPSPRIKTFNDHRIAMAFELLATRCKSVVIEDASAVTKSFPDFWSELQKLNFELKQSN